MRMIESFFEFLEKHIDVQAAFVTFAVIWCIAALFFVCAMIFGPPGILIAFLIFIGFAIPIFIGKAVKDW